MPQRKQPRSLQTICQESITSHLAVTCRKLQVLLINIVTLFYSCAAGLNPAHLSAFVRANRPASECDSAKGHTHSVRYYFSVASALIAPLEKLQVSACVSDYDLPAPRE
jgi:hypothetical protein